MKVVSVETVACDAGWRNYNFLKVVTDDGLIGWSEYDGAYGPPTLSRLIEAYSPHVVGEDPRQHEAIFARLSAVTRAAPYGLTAEALGAIENALLDVKAKALGVPVYELLGGKIRDSVPLYWSHCTTWRIDHAEYYGVGITDLDGVRTAGRDVRERGFRAAKTNMFRYGPEGITPWMIGFGAPFDPSLNVDRGLIKDVAAHLGALREGAGPDVDLLIDMNFNARTDGFVRLLRSLSDFDPYWIELDMHNPDAIAHIRSQSGLTIASGETLFGVRQYLPYLQKQAIDVAVVDAVWNGVWQSMKIAAVADSFDVNVAPHNFYSHLATFMHLHYSAAVPNLQIMEDDVDRLLWDDELFGSVPEIVNGSMIVPDRPGWGIEPNEEALRRHPPRNHSYLGLDGAGSSA